MQSQTTTPEVIEHEKHLVQQQLGLDTTDAIIFIDAGWDSRVYMINDGYSFFKFPRSDKIRQRYQYEIAALKLAATVNPAVQVPEVSWGHPSNEYFGYHGVPGTVLAEMIPTLTGNTKQTIGSIIGTFLKQLHELSLPGARMIPVDREIKQFQEWYQPAVPVIQQMFSESEQRQLRTLVEDTWPAQLLSLGSDTVLCHGDLGFRNCLYQDETTIGIIDFGDVGYYDRSKDFINLTDPEIFEAALQAYGDSPELRQKIAIRQTVLQIIKLTASIGKQDEQGVHQAITQLGEVLRQNKTT
nr:Phosphotransferase enzyme family [uncultured bacterium]AIA14004.1 Phosphotransferase enzyme family [uncultured bacterium]